MSVRVTEGYENMFHPKKPAKNPNIWCYKCKQNSGWVDNDLVLMRGHYELKCSHCKGVCVKGMSNIPK